MRKGEIIALIIVVISFIISIFFYSSMPATMISHWGINGESNGQMTKFWGTFLIPILLIGMALLFFILVRIDPLKENIKLFRNYYDGFIIAILLFMLYVHLLVLMWNFGFVFNMLQLMLPALAVLFLLIGIMMRKVKRNWFLGIRTPWTMSSDYVWDKTHKLGAILFMISGVFVLIGVVFWKYAIFLILIPILLATFVTIIYSYVVYKQEQETKQHSKKTRK